MKTNKVIPKLLSVAILMQMSSIASAQFMVSQTGDIYRTTKLEMLPGESKTITLMVKNELEEEIQLDIYGADSSQSSQGVFTVKNKSDEKKLVGSWISMSNSELTLGPKEKKEITYTITIPEKVTPGTYGGGLAVGTKPSNNIESGSGAITSTRIVEPILVSIPGERVFKLSWEDFSYNEKNSTFYLKFKNEGNIVQKISGEVSISGLSLLNEKKIVIPINEITLFQGDSIEVPVNLKEKPFFAFLKAEAEITHKEVKFTDNQKVEEGSLSKEVSLQFIPWNWIIAIIIIIVSAAIGKFIQTKKHKKFLSTFESYKVQEGDSLENLAQNRNISWKKLAKINKINPPFTLKVGTSLLIPPKK